MHTCMQFGACAQYLILKDLILQALFLKPIQHIQKGSLDDLECQNAEKQVM